MKTTTTDRNNGIKWTHWLQLDHLDFADDLALLSHNHSLMQDKTTLLETTSAGTGLKINRKKTELMKMNCQCTSHSWWRAHKGGGVFHLPGKCGWPSGRHRPRCHSQNRLGKSSFCHAQKHLGICRNQHENQTPHLQLQCEVSPALRMWDMADNTDDATKDPDILQHLSEVHLQNPMAREDPKWRSMGVSGTGTSGQADTAEEVGLDWTHPQEASIQHHTPSPDLEPAGEEEERPASQQLEARHWSRAETAGDQLVQNDKSSPEQSAMAGGRWWPMLHWER